MPAATFTQCTSCKAKLRIKNAAVEGKKTRCPKCEQVFVVRLLKVAAPAAASPAGVKAPRKKVAAAPDETILPPTAPVPTERVPLDSAPSIVSWEEGIGDDKKYHIAHVSSAGITLVLKMKDYKQFAEVVAEAKAAPIQAAAMLQELPKAVQFAPEQISKATYAQQLNQLAIFDQEQKKTKVPEGKEQADLFAAIKQHLGGSESEEEADAWSVMQSPLFITAVIAVIGGFFIWFTTICEPNYEASGRRSGMKQLLNSIGYSIGPVWMSVAVGSLAALVLGMMIYQLIKRPIRQVLEYPG